MVALPNVTKDGSVLFAKNSDREPNEAHIIKIIPATDYKAGSNVKCTYIEIPQVEHTYAVLLAKPFWIWGAEMGANEHGVVIGNEAVFTKVPYGKEPGLIGMDFLRLALERASDAKGALDTIVLLLEKYSQSGNCSYEHKLYYHNSYLIADRKEAWVLETVGRHWAALKIKDFYSISNALSITNNWDFVSKDLVKVAIERKWCRSKKDFSFSRSYSDYLFTHFSKGRERRECSMAFLKRNKSKINIKSMIKLLRSHGTDSSNWRPDKSLVEWSICMHKGFGPIRTSQSVGSFIAHLSQDGDTYWVTGTSAPCTGIFKPLWIDVDLPNMGPKPNNYFDQSSLWWRHEILHREVMKDYSNRISEYRNERDSLELKWIEVERRLINASKREREAFITETFQIAQDVTEDWIKKIKSSDIKKQNRFYYKFEWQGINSKAKLSL